MEIRLPQRSRAAQSANNTTLPCSTEYDIDQLNQIVEALSLCHHPQKRAGLPLSTWQADTERLLQSKRIDQDQSMKPKECLVAKFITLSLPALDAETVANEIDRLGRFCNATFNPKDKRVGKEQQWEKTRDFVELGGLASVVFAMRNVIADSLPQVGSDHAAENLRVLERGCFTIWSAASAYSDHDEREWVTEEPESSLARELSPDATKLFYMLREQEAWPFDVLGCSIDCALELEKGGYETPTTNILVLTSRAIASLGELAGSGCASSNGSDFEHDALYYSWKAGCHSALGHTLKFVTEECSGHLLADDVTTILLGITHHIIWLVNFVIRPHHRLENLGLQTLVPNLVSSLEMWNAQPPPETMDDEVPDLANGYYCLSVLAADSDVLKEACLTAGARPSWLE